MGRRFTAPLLALLLAIAAGPALADKPIAPERIEGTTRVGAEEVVRLIQSSPELVIIDARREEEYAKGHIEGAISLVDTEMDAQSLSRHAGPDTPLLFYCNGERCLRSTHACHKALEAGYRQIYWFRGGWTEWLGEGLPIARE